MQERRRAVISLPPAASQLPLKPLRTRRALQSSGEALISLRITSSSHITACGGQQAPCLDKQTSHRATRTPFRDQRPINTITQGYTPCCSVHVPQNSQLSRIIKPAQTPTLETQLLSCSSDFPLQLQKEDFEVS